MADIECKMPLSHDQVIAGVQCFYDMLLDIHEDCINEENHAQKDLILGLIEAFTEIFDSILCYKG